MSQEQEEEQQQQQQQQQQFQDVDEAVKMSDSSATGGAGSNQQVEDDIQSADWQLPLQESKVQFPSIRPCRGWGVEGGKQGGKGGS